MQNQRSAKVRLARAVYWFQLAAEQGHAEAQYRLGQCYARGRGVKKDLAKAYFWLTLASKQNNRDGEKQRTELARQLPADTVAKTELSAVGWKPITKHVEDPVR
jgi:TPR repeat protein